MIEVLGTPEDDQEMVADVLESLAEKLRAGVVSDFRVRWRGDRQVELRTTLNLEKLAEYVHPEDSENEGDSDEADGSN